MDNQELRGTTQSDCEPGQLMNECVNRNAMLTPKEDNKIRQINIEELNRGFIVRIGCHTFAISTKAELTTRLIEYINEPSNTEKKWYAGDLF